MEQPTITLTEDQLKQLYLVIRALKQLPGVTTSGAIKAAFKVAQDLK